MTSPSTPLPSLPSHAVSARAAVLTLVVAGGVAGTAISEGHRPATGPTRTAILAGPDASPDRLAQAIRGAPGNTTEIRPATTLYEAQAAAVALAAEGFDTVIAVGAQARSAVGQAAAAEVGDGTDWRIAAR